MRKNQPHKKTLGITREDKMMVAVKYNVDEDYINKVIRGARKGITPEAQGKICGILRSLKNLALANNEMLQYKTLVLEAEELADSEAFTNEYYKMQQKAA